MEKLYNFLGRFILVALFSIGASMSVTSCVSDEYDFDKEVDMSLNVGGSLTIPLGYSVPITLGEMIDDMMGDDGIEYLEKFDDGSGNDSYSYAISMKDNIEVDLSSISSTEIDPMSIPSGVETFSTEFKSMDFGSFDLDVAGDDIPVSTGLTEVTPSAIDVASEPIVIDAKIVSKLQSIAPMGEIVSGLSISTLNEGSPLTVELDDNDNIIETVSLNVEGMECPSTVKQVYDITFEDKTASVSIDVTEIAKGFTDFEMVIPFLKVTFPKGFVLSKSSDGSSVQLDEYGEGEDKYYVVAANNITLTNASPSYSLEFVIDNYDIVLENNIANEGDDSGTLDAITGLIECELYKDFTISGTTTDNDFDDQIVITVDAGVEIVDMTLTVDGIEIKVDDQTEVGGTTKIYLGDDDMIKSISSVTLKEEDNQNQLKLAINSINIIEGLKANGSSLEVWFPEENFNITTTSDVTYDSSNKVYKLSIPLSNIVISGDGSGGFDSVITLEQILFAQPEDGSSQIKQETEAGENFDEYYIEFTPNITIKGTTIEMAGDVTLNDYNTFVATYEAVGVETQTISTEIAAVNTNGLAIESAEAEISGYSADIESQTIAISPDETAIDEAISEIYRLDIYSGSVDAPEKIYVNFDIVVNIDLSDDDAPALSFTDYNIMLPTFLEFAETLPLVEKEVEIDGTTVTRTFQVIELDGDFTPVVVDGKNVCQYTAQYEITAIDFTAYEGTVLTTNESDEQVLALNDLIILEGGVKIGEGTIDSSIIGSAISGSATYTIDDMSISKLSGIVSPEAETGNENIPLDDLSDALDGDVSIVLSNPTIVITATSSFDIPIQINELVLTTTRNLTEPENDDDEVETETLKTITLSEPILIEPATSGTTTTSVYISSKDMTGTEYDQYVKMEGLENLLSSIPDNVVMSYSAGVTTIEGHTHTIDLTRGEDDPYTFEIDYDLNIPLAFESFEFEYSTKIEGMGGDLEQLVDYVDELELKLEIESTLPINLTIKDITPIDEEGDALSGLISLISSNVDENGYPTIAANSTSVVELSITNNDSDDLLLFDGLELDIFAFIDGTEGGEFNSDQNISIKVSVCVPSGFNIDLNDM